MKFDEEGRLIAICIDMPSPAGTAHAAAVITYEAQDFDLPVVE